MGYPASDAMDRSAAFLNDQAKEVYTYDVQLAYLRTALTDLEMEYEINNIPVTNVTTASIDIDAGEDEVTRATTPAAPPEYPADLVEIQGIFERLQGTDDPFNELVRKEYIQHQLEGTQLAYLSYYVWEEEVIRFNPGGATSNLEIKIDYIKSLFSGIEDEDSIITVTNSINFLAYRTAALCAQYIGENPTRANELNAEAVLALNQALGISNKGRQAITTRRRPFMASYRSRGRTW